MKVDKNAWMIVHRLIRTWMTPLSLAGSGPARTAAAAQLANTLPCRYCSNVCNEEAATCNLWAATEIAMAAGESNKEIGGVMEDSVASA